MSNVIDILHELFSNASAAQEHIIFVQHDVLKKIKDALREKMKEGGITYKPFPDGLRASKGLEIDSFTWLGKTIHIADVDQFLISSDECPDPEKNDPGEDEEERE